MMIGMVGLKPDEFWSNTLRHNSLAVKAFDSNNELKWLQNRNIEFALYNTAFGFNGKKIYKNINHPKDLYELPSDKHIDNTKVVVDLERALAAREGKIISKDVKVNERLSNILKHISK